MNRLTIIKLIVGFLLAMAGLAMAQTGAPPPEAEQVLFLIDDSGSMTETAFDPDNPSASRWEVLQRVYPQWLQRLGQNTLIGALSVGGPSCGAPPPINLPVGTDRALITAAIGSARPDGWTNLNSALKAAPGLFAPGVHGGKRIILLSDGANVCPPLESTCEIARELHRDHGIVIDVAAWITDPAMVDEFQCMAKVAGGTFTAPRTIDEWVNIPLPVLDPSHYVVLALGFATLLLAARVLYRHGYHVLGWGTGQATLAAGILLGLGALLLYLVLFAGAGIVAALLGAAVLAAMFAVAARRKTRSSLLAQATTSPWTMALLVALALLVPRVSSATDNLPDSCAKVAQGSPRFHHILALDMSGSVVEHIGHMKSLLACYAEMYALPNEEISLIVFARDHAGTVQELRTFTVPQSGSTAILNALLDDLEIQNPKSTKTYFRPLADYLNQFLRGVRLQPVVVVVSDGQSDGYADAKRGKVNFKEIPFESFGKRGVYSVPGMNNWKVAIQGGSGLDLTALFQKPVVSRGNRNQTPQPLGPVIDPCLIEPDLLVETEEKIVLWPRWNLFSSLVDGSVSIQVRNECVARFRSFKVELRRGDETLVIGSVNNTLIDQSPRSFTFSISQSARGVESAEAVIQVILDQGGTTRAIYPQKPSVVTINEVSYWSAFGVYWGASGSALLLLVGLAVFTVRQRRVRERNRPEVVMVLGGHGVPLSRYQSVTVGGEGCTLTVPGVAPGAVLAVAEWTGSRGELTLRPGNGFRMKVNGVDVVGSAIYRLGQPLQFIDRDGNVFDVTLFAGTPRDIGFGTPFPGGGNGSAAGGVFPGFGGIVFPGADSGFEPVSGGSGGKGIGTNADTYI